MPTEAKRETVESLRAEIANSQTLVVSEYRGLTVKEIAEIRRALRKQDVTYRVVKNRLMRIAADGPTGEALGPLLVGPTAIAFGAEESTTAKAVLDAVRPYKVVRVTGAVVGARAIDAEGVQRLAALPPREVVLAQLAGGFAGSGGDRRRAVRGTAARHGGPPRRAPRPEGHGRLTGARHDRHPGARGRHTEERTTSWPPSPTTSCSRRSRR